VGAGDKSNLKFTGIYQEQYWPSMLGCPKTMNEKHIYYLSKASIIGQGAKKKMQSN
jgi:hypothetical protein